MAQYPVGADELSAEVVKKALVWYYRAWSYYWGHRPVGCVIHPAESFVELTDEVIVFLPKGATPDDVRRLRNAFTQPLTFIAATLPEGSPGYCTTTQACHDASPRLVRFLDQIAAEHADLKDATSDGRGQERRRQEWRFSEAGEYAKYSDGKTVRLAFRPNEGNPFTFTIIENAPGDLYFTESKSGPQGDIVEKGKFRRHRHDVGKQTYDNLDLFPETDYPTLWRLVKAGRGFKAFPRRIARIANVSPGP
jgi:hypothetical protein